jgi:hypothetical protein
VRFHPNSLYLATGSSDWTARLWDVQKGACVRAFLGHRGNVSALAFSPDGRYLASAGEDLAVNLWDLGSGRRIKSMTGHTASIYSLAFSQESALLVSGGADWTVRCWDVKGAGGLPTRPREPDAHGRDEPPGNETCAALGPDACVQGLTVRAQDGPGADVPHEADADHQRPVHGAEPVHGRGRVRAAGTTYLARVGSPCRIYARGPPYVKGDADPRHRCEQGARAVRVLVRCCRVEALLGSRVKESAVHAEHVPSILSWPRTPPSCPASRVRAFLGPPPTHPRQQS